MTPDACGRCGEDPAKGLATIDGQRFCHDGPDPTCYMEQSWENSGVEGTTIPKGLLALQWKTDLWRSE
jgi:hypothetical protein